MDNLLLGVDVGASGIKGAIVNVKTGVLQTERLRFPTPEPSLPGAVAKVFAQLTRDMEWSGPIGCGFPAIIKKGVAYSAANIDKSWIGVNAEELLSDVSGNEVFVVNDADAAGIAEMRFGQGRQHNGTVILITIGSGLGTGIFVDGKLIPNTEFGHIYLRGHQEVAERYASNRAKELENLSWETWARRFDEYLQHLELLFSPDLFILGGGTSKYFDLYQQYLTIPTAIVPADLLNNAGMIGAAIYAWEQLESLGKIR